MRAHPTTCYAVAMSSPTHVRFPAAVDRQLTDYARSGGTAKSTVVVGALREWLAMQAHPGVVFVATVTGERRAAVVAGPQVWTIAEAWQQHEQQDRDSATLAEVLGLGMVEVEAALGYWADHREEIDELIARHHREQDEALAAWERRRALDAL